MVVLPTKHPDQGTLGGEAVFFRSAAGGVVRVWDVPDHRPGLPADEVVEQGSPGLGIARDDRAEIRGGSPRSAEPKSNQVRGISFDPGPAGDPSVTLADQSIQHPSAADPEGFAVEASEFRIIGGKEAANGRGCGRGCRSLNIANRDGDRGPAPAGEGPFRLETQGVVDRFSGWRRVEFDTRDALLGQKTESVLKQRSSESATALFGLDEDHADPGEVGTVDRGGGGADGAAIRFGDEAPVGLGREEPFPIAECLVPTHPGAECVGKAQVLAGERANSDGRFHEVSEGRWAGEAGEAGRRGRP